MPKVTLYQAKNYSLQKHNLCSPRYNRPVFIKMENNMRRFILFLLLLTPLHAVAESALPFMKELAGDIELPRPWGISVDFYTMDQDYDIDYLIVPGIPIGDPSDIKVTNDIEHYDLQGDVWLFPFLNVFGVVGHVEADTLVDLSEVVIPDLPFALDTLPVAYEGKVYGLGFTLVYGTKNWFASATSTWTETDVKGDLDSKVKSLAVQPRVGLIRSNWRFWLGAMYLDVDEKHSGVFELPFIGYVPFSVDLVTKDNWNYGGGVGYQFSDRANLRFELGFGNRTHTLFNFNVRF